MRADMRPTPQHWRRPLGDALDTVSPPLALKGSEGFGGRRKGSVGFGMVRNGSEGFEGVRRVREGSEGFHGRRSFCSILNAQTRIVCRSVTKQVYENTAYKECVSYENVYKVHPRAQIHTSTRYPPPTHLTPATPLHKLYIHITNQMNAYNIFRA